MIGVEVTDTCRILKTQDEAVILDRQTLHIVLLCGFVGRMGMMTAFLKTPVAILDK